MMEPKDMAMKIANVLDDKKGIDVMIIDIATKASFAEHLVLASMGRSGNRSWCRIE
jgi:ribosome-associated protein